MVDVPEEQPIQFEIVEGGSSRGALKLVSSDGYSYVKKRELVNGAIDWRCTVRGRNTGCPAKVKQRGSEYLTSGSHNHEAKPGLVTAVKIKAEVKQ